MSLFGTPHMAYRKDRGRERTPSLQLVRRNAALFLKTQFSQTWVHNVQDSGPYGVCHDNADRLKSDLMRGFARLMIDWVSTLGIQERPAVVLLLIGGILDNDSSNSGQQA